MKFFKYLRLSLGVVNAHLLGLLISQDAPSWIILISFSMTLFFLIAFIIENESDSKKTKNEDEKIPPFKL